MTKKSNIILIGLVVLTVISIGIAFSNYLARAVLFKKYRALVLENDKLRASNEELGAKFSDLDSRKRSLEEKVKQLKAEAEAIVSQRDDLQERFDIISNEKEALIKRLQEVSQAKVVPTKEVKKSAETAPTDVSAQDEYWAGLLKEKSSLQIQLEELKQRVEKLMGERNQIEKEKSEMKLALNNLSHQNEDLTRQLNYAKKLADDLSNQLVTEKKDARAMQSQLETLKEENFVLSNQLKKNIAAKLTLEQKLSEIKEESATLKTRLERTDAILEQRVSDLMDIKKELNVTVSDLGLKSKSVQLPPIVVKSESESKKPKVSVETMEIPPEEGGVQAKIVSVDEKNNFVIIDKGRNQGVGLNQTLGVYRGNERIATIKVIKIRDNIAACDINQLGRTISVGDSVR